MNTKIRTLTIDDFLADVKLHPAASTSEVIGAFASVDHEVNRQGLVQGIHRGSEVRGLDWNVQRQRHVRVLYQYLVTRFGPLLVRIEQSSCKTETNINIYNVAFRLATIHLFIFRLGSDIARTSFESSFIYQVEIVAAETKKQNFFHI